MTDNNVGEPQKHVIVHIEDDAVNWQPLVAVLEVAIEEYLSDVSEDAFASLHLERPTPPIKFPACTEIHWRDCDVERVVQYWWVTEPNIRGVEEHISATSKGDITFVLDVMQPRGEGEAGLHSTLDEALKAIAPYVESPAKQVRLFTAYSTNDGVGFPTNAPEIYRKGADTEKLITFLLGRIGFGG